MKSLYIITVLAWRNVLRNRRRTFLTLLTIIIGCAMIVLLNALSTGGHEQMIEDAVALNTGHIQIHEKGFHENQTLDYAFMPSPELLDAVRSVPHVQAFAERIMSGGLLSFADSTRGIAIQGIDPEREPQITDIHRKILPGGRFLRPADTTHAVIGDVLARNTGARVGDQVAIISQGFDGSIAAERFTVVGIFSTGSPDFDRELMFIPLNQAAETFSMMGFVHSLVIRTDAAEHAESVARTLRQVLPQGDTGLEVMDWTQLMPELLQFIVMDDISGYIFNFILFMVVAFGVLNTIQMAVFERTREFGVMLSIGTGPGRIVSMVMMESFFIAFWGILTGISLGWCAGLYFQAHPIDYSAYSKEIAIWGITTTLCPARVTLANIAVTSGLTFFLSLFFSVFPAYRAARLNPVEAVRKL